MHYSGIDRGRRRGVTSMLAMMFLVLFSALAVGFYSSVNTGVQIAGNEVDSKKALLAAESGMAYVQHLLSNVSIKHGTPESQLWPEVVAQVRQQVDRKPVLKGEIAQEGPGFLALNDVTLPNKSWFSARLSMDGSQVVARVTGGGGDATSSRAVQMAYQVDQRTPPIFRFGVATRGPISMNSNARITGSGPDNYSLGSVLTTTARRPAVTLDSNSSVSGDISFAASAGGALNITSNSTIAGLRPSDPEFATHLHYGVTPPEFPAIDTSAFKHFAGNIAYGGVILSQPNRKYDTGVLRNILIKANTNPEFSSNMRVEGVIYIETPNKVVFSSNTTIRGAIVVQNDPTGDITTNSIEMSSNVKLLPIESLPNNPFYPAPLRALTGSAILAPKFSLHLNSNFGSVGGSIVAGKMHFDSNAQGTVKGSVINLEDTAVQMNSNAAITVEKLPPGKPPAGFIFSGYFAPMPGTYTELDH
jgi:hypothetical protein